MTSALVCTKTGARLPIDAPVWRSAAGELLDIEHEARFPVDVIQSRPANMWRYREAIPLPRNAEPVTFGEGMTPLVSHRWRGRDCLLKLDGLFPSGSYKDRGASVMMSRVKALGITHVVEDSSGNAGSAVAMYGARAGITCDIYVPESASAAKLVQMRAFGATVVRVSGTRQDTQDAVWDAAQSTYYASHVWDPFFFHGTKTFAFEIVEQLGWKAPDAVVIPTGNGTLLLGAFIGFSEMVRAGVIERVPRLIAVQADACAPLAIAFERGRPSPEPIIAADTIAEGVAIPMPLRGEQCLRAVRDTGGTILRVNDEDALRALREAMLAGFFIEPTCAIALAAMDQLRDVTGTIVVAITGNGLKTSSTIEKLMADH